MVLVLVLVFGEGRFRRYPADVHPDIPAERKWERVRQRDRERGRERNDLLVVGE